jgi:hypothetical protein
MSYRIDWITLNIPVEDDRYNTLCYAVSCWTTNVHHKQSKGIARVCFSNLPDRNYVEILAWCRSMLAMENVTLSRLDLAFDFAQPFDIVTLYQVEREKRPKGYKMGLLGSPDNGYTCYLGSRESGLFRRIYDKGKQLKMSSDAVRIEIEYKRKMAKKMFMLLSDTTTADNCAKDAWLKLVEEMPQLAYLWRPQGVLPHRTCAPRNDTKWMLDNANRLSEIFDGVQSSLDKPLRDVVDRCMDIGSLSQIITLFQRRYDYLQSRRN